jgi:UDP-2,4-diacetamido-2,4,6-trideoxy-beta-L-altropyranose hydrolase
LPASASSTQAGEDYAQWLGVAQAADAAQTVAALDGDRPNWLVVDHYGLDAEWETALRPHVNHIMVIDDLANRPHDCDVVLDQNFSAEGDERYKDLVPGGCKLLTGPRYALLRPEYADYRKCLRARDGRVTRVLVFMGGSDPGNLTGMALKALSAPELEELHVDVVVGSSNPYADEIASLAQLRPNTTVHGPRPHLADLMASADLALGAGGATTWERMCLGVPSLVVSLAENQRPACDALDAVGLVRYLGQSSDVGEATLRAAVKEMMADPERMQRMSAESMSVVDGQGTKRIVEHLVPTPREQLQLRVAEPGDLLLYFGWVNDPEVRKQSVNTDTIGLKAHKKWFGDRLSDPDSYLFVLQAGDLPVGQVRFDCRDDVASVDYTLDPLVRGRGWGTTLISSGVARLWQSRPLSICARVRMQNLASRKVFGKLKFSEFQHDAFFCQYILPHH